MRITTILMVLALFSIPLTACRRELIFEKDVRVVYTTQSPDGSTLFIGGDDFVRDFGPNSADQFYARLRMTGSRESSGITDPYNQQSDRTMMIVSVRNARTGAMSYPVTCEFLSGYVTSITYTGQFVTCQLQSRGW